MELNSYWIPGVFFVIVFHDVKECRGQEQYACNSPYINNGRPVNVPEEVYAEYCCKASKYSYGTSTSRFDCSSRGGCCGSTDNQYCCDLDTFRIQLGVGLTFGTLVLLGVIALILYCYVKSYYRALNQEVYCKSCCVCKVRNKHVFNGFRENVIFRHRESPPPSPSLTSQSNSGLERLPYPEPSCFDTSMMPSAPPDSIPRGDGALPSYSDVMNNPTAYPKTTRPS